MQYNPVVVVQSEDPQEQGIKLIEMPSVVEHGAALLHELSDAVQNIPVEAVQSEVPHLQSVPAVLVGLPSVKSQMVDGRDEQESSVSVQNIPVEVVQSEVPHLQSVPSVLVVMPLMYAQVTIGRGEQALYKAAQYNPVSDVQSEVPQEQGSALAEASSFVAHGAFLQELIEDSQNNPVADVQSEVPHQQGIVLTELPSVMVHGAAFLQELMDAVQNMPVVAAPSHTTSATVYSPPLLAEFQLPIVS